MFDRFTDRAKRVMDLALQEAQSLGHAHIGTEHLLVGLVQEEAGVAANVLRNIGLDLNKIRVEVHGLVQSGGPSVTSGQLPLTPRAKKALEYALEEASQLGHNDIGTEHLLLGLLRESDGVPAQVLLNLGLKLEEVRVEVLELLGAEVPHPTGPPDEKERQSRESAQGRKPGAFDRFTDRSRRVMGLARQEAQRYSHGHIGTEHILLGLVQEESGVAANVLKNMGVDLEKIRPEVEKLVKQGKATVTMGQLPFTPRAKKLLEYALEEASQLGHNYIGTEHLLLGLLRESDGVAAQVLRNLGITLESVRAEVLELLGGEFPRLSGPPGEEGQRGPKKSTRPVLGRRGEIESVIHVLDLTERVLLDMLRAVEDVPAQVLRNFGLRFEEVRVELRALLGAELPAPGVTPDAPPVPPEPAI